MISLLRVRKNFSNSNFGDILYRKDSLRTKFIFTTFIVYLYCVSLVRLPPWGWLVITFLELFFFTIQFILTFLQKVYKGQKIYFKNLKLNIYNWSVKWIIHECTTWFKPVELSRYEISQHSSGKDEIFARMWFLVKSCRLWNIKSSSHIRCSVVICYVCGYIVNQYLKQMSTYSIWILCEGVTLSSCYVKKLMWIILSFIG